MKNIVPKSVQECHLGLLYKEKELLNTKHDLFELFREDDFLFFVCLLSNAGEEVAA